MCYTPGKFLPAGVDMKPRREATSQPGWPGAGIRANTAERQCRIQCSSTAVLQPTAQGPYVALAVPLPTAVFALRLAMHASSIILLDVTARAGHVLSSQDMQNNGLIESAGLPTVIAIALPPAIAGGKKRVTHSVIISASQFTNGHIFEKHFHKVNEKYNEKYDAK